MKKAKPKEIPVYINLVERGKPLKRFTEFEAAKAEAVRIAGKEFPLACMTLQIVGISVGEKKLDTQKAVK